MSTSAPGPRRRRHRRVDAAPTNPQADRGDDVPPVDERDEDPEGARSRPTTDPREAWIVRQRPPHWD